MVTVKLLFVIVIFYLKKSFTLNLLFWIFKLMLSSLFAEYKIPEYSVCWQQKCRLHLIVLLLWQENSQPRPGARRPDMERRMEGRINQIFPLNWNIWNWPYMYHRMVLQSQMEERNLNLNSFWLIRVEYRVELRCIRPGALGALSAATQVAKIRRAMSGHTNR